MFLQIKLHEWRQFNNIQIDFDNQMTILTGENGTGKTTILNILSRHFGWNSQFISTLLPISKKLGKYVWSDVWEAISSDLDIKPGSSEVGSIRYQNGQECKLMVQLSGNQAQYNPQYSNQQTVFGLHIPSHQPAFTYYR